MKPMYLPILGIVILATTATSQAWAQSTSIDATVTFSEGVVLGNEQNMEFGQVDFDSAPTTGDTVTIGTDGSIQYSGTTFSGGGTGTAGSIDIAAGNNGQVVEVFCDQAATLTDGNGGSINITGIKAAPENATGSYAGAGAFCNGTSGLPATNFTLNIGTLDTFKFGGVIDGATATSFNGGSFSTGNALGDDIQIDVYYQ